jgi:hypothetical protein
MGEYEKQANVVVYICPVCKYEFFIYFDDLRRDYGFDGKNFKKLPKIPCHICHESYAEGKEMREVPDSWADPLDIWIDPS